MNSRQFHQAGMKKWQAGNAVQEAMQEIRNFAMA